MASITCGNCHETHRSVEGVRVCHAGKGWCCTWLLERHGEDGLYVVECGALSWEDERGYGCAAGHDHVYAEVRDAEGWDYASDAQEAEMMRRNGLGRGRSRRRLHLTRTEHAPSRQRPRRWKSGGAAVHLVSVWTQAENETPRETIARSPSRSVTSVSRSR